MEGITSYQQPWLGRKWVEVIFILLPPFVSLGIIAVWPALFRDSETIPDAWWVILILLVDVAHVYSTLYRTYFDKASYRRYGVPMILIPVLGFVAGVLLYLAGAWLFWRLLAYLAVFHFIRQQYGFLRIYSRQEKLSPLLRGIDHFTIYYATIYPLIYWHLGEPRNFSWFVDNDFFLFHNDLVLRVATLLYYVLLGVYVVRELYSLVRKGYVNIPRVGILTGTILSWYFGIVYFNGDMAFTLLNVVSHGIPYMALVWLYGERQHGRQGGDGAGTSGGTGVLRSSFLRVVFSRWGVFIFLGIIFLLAYLEEGLWDMTVWKEHVSLFTVFHLVGGKLHGMWLAFVVPLLALPQVTHYIIDGFIWRRPSKEQAGETAAGRLM
jgi:hypothetical protein